MTADNFLCKPNIIEFNILISSFFSANKRVSRNIVNTTYNNNYKINLRNKLPVLSVFSLKLSFLDFSMSFNFQEFN